MQLVTAVGVLLALLAPVGALGATAAAPSDVDRGATTGPSQLDVDADRVLLSFDVREDGSARAVVAYRFALNETAATDAFASLRTDVSANRSKYLDRFEQRVARTLRTAENATGRQMSVSNLTVRATSRQLPRPHGVVEYRFVWEGFAAVETGELRVGDALGGLYLAPGEQLQISWPDGYRARTVHDAVSERRSNAAIWAGPTWFDGDGPRLVLEQRGVQIDAVPVALVGLSALFALGGGAVWWRGRRTEGDRPPSPAAGGDHPTNATNGGAEATADEGGVEPALLSNEERVLRAIETEGGRVKQQELVATLDWSDAKVSRVVSTLRERGDLEGFRIGNENVLSLPSEPDEAEEEP